MGFRQINFWDGSLTRFNGVVLLGNKVSPYNVIEKNGLLCRNDRNHPSFNIYDFRAL